VRHLQGDPCQTFIVRYLCESHTGTWVPVSGMIRERRAFRGLEYGALGASLNHEPTSSMSLQVFQLMGLVLGGILKSALPSSLHGSKYLPVSRALRRPSNRDPIRGNILYAEHNWRIDVAAVELLEGPSGPRPGYPTPVAYGTIPVGLRAACVTLRLAAAVHAAHSSRGLSWTDFSSLNSIPGERK
jgi:hypothetical protein